ncbi:hypothetical protein B9Q02_08660 [Candidatus Marsarchaeota G1 archaeon BE_D]|jgi:Protein implicated in ribosomal biogenesis, Nop56p homolog|uniref:Nop domain-containing protein n=1 Tax=Candidatus Marsarchaeota G1 archaeon BE_D TaxID=1978156 RepID=A0A2R6AEL9_9ARCH|nr:MAG: hypothetical protein B9Q02_08660 [Candidatus Marsarchaeota G1 archaeon BE_D]
MKAYLASTIYGCFLVDSTGKVVKALRCSPNDQSAISKLLEGVEKLGIEKVETIEPELAKFAQLVQPNPSIASIYSHESFAQSLGLSKDEVYELVRSSALEATKKGITEASAQLDKVVAQAVKAVDEFDKTLNIFASRIREWYGLHFPELGEMIEDHSSYLRLVSKVGLRTNFTLERLLSLGYKEENAKRILEKAKNSIGAPMSEENFEPIRIMSEAVYQLYSLRNSLTSYIDRLMADVAPNLRGFAGPLLGARLIALAGSLEKLAKFPSSTVQVLGAEKALFRAIRKGAKPPKHGVIFQDPVIHTAPKWQRGKIARAYAGKLSIAARLDFYGGEDLSDKLRAEFEARIREIKQKFAKPPQSVSKRKMRKA